MKKVTFVENVDRILTKNKKLFTAHWGINWEKRGSEITFTRNGCYFASLDDRQSGTISFSVLNFHPLEDPEIINWLAGVLQFIHKKLYPSRQDHFLAILSPLKNK